MMSKFISLRRAASRSGRRRGNAVMEAALVLPILLLLSFGTVEFGHFFYCKHTMQGAARDGARTAILPSSSTASVKAAVANTMTSAGFTSTQYAVSITNGAYPTSTTQIDPSTATTGTAIKVQVSATWGTIGMRPVGTMPMFSNFWPLKSTTQVIGFTVMVKE